MSSQLARDFGDAKEVVPRQALAAARLRVLDQLSSLLADPSAALAAHADAARLRDFGEGGDADADGADDGGGSDDALSAELRQAELAATDAHDKFLMRSAGQDGNRRQDGIPLAELCGDDDDGDDDDDSSSDADAGAAATTASRAGSGRSGGSGGGGGVQFQCFPAGLAQVQRATFSADGQWALVVSEAQSQVIVLDGATLAPVVRLPGVRGPRGACFVQSRGVRRSAGSASAGAAAAGDTAEDDVDEEAPFVLHEAAVGHGLASQEHDDADFAVGADRRRDGDFALRVAVAENGAHRISLFDVFVSEEERAAGVASAPLCDSAGELLKRESLKRDSDPMPTHSPEGAKTSVKRAVPLARYVALGYISDSGREISGGDEGEPLPQGGRRDDLFRYPQAVISCWLTPDREVIVATVGSNNGAAVLDARTLEVIHFVQFPDWSWGILAVQHDEVAPAARACIGGISSGDNRGVEGAPPTLLCCVAGNGYQMRAYNLGAALTMAPGEFAAGCKKPSGSHKVHWSTGAIENSRALFSLRQNHTALVDGLLFSTSMSLHGPRDEEGFLDVYVLPDFAFDPERNHTVRYAKDERLPSDPDDFASELAISTNRHVGHSTGAPGVCAPVRLALPKRLASLASRGRHTQGITGVAYDPIRRRLIVQSFRNAFIYSLRTTRVKAARKA